MAGGRCRVPPKGDSANPAGVWDAGLPGEFGGGVRDGENLAKVVPRARSRSWACRHAGHPNYTQHYDREVHQQVDHQEQPLRDLSREIFYPFTHYLPTT